MSTELGHRLSVLVTGLLSVAALAISWAGYQASVWNGEQALHGGNAMTLRTNSLRASTRAGQLSMVDVQVFTSWAAAFAKEDTLLARFYERRFRREFAPAFRAWLASRPLRSPDAAPTPFTLPEYRLADEAEARRLSEAADRESAAGQRANEISDGYVLDVVILSGVYFVAGAAQHRSSRRLQTILVFVALLMCATGIYLLATSPLA